MAPSAPHRPHAWILAAGPGAPGLTESLAGLARADSRVFLTGPGLAWLAAPGSLGQLREACADLALCSQGARAQGLSAATTPAGVRWSSLATWMAELDGAPFGWIAA